MTKRSKIGSSGGGAKKPPKQKGKTGRKAWVPTELEKNIAIRQAQIGMPWKWIAIGLGKDYDTVIKYLGEDLKRAKVKACSKMLDCMFNMGVNGNFNAAKYFLSKNLPGYEEDSIVLEAAMVPEGEGNTLEGGGSLKQDGFGTLVRIHVKKRQETLPDS